VPDPEFEPRVEPIEVVPVVVLSQVFPARPSSIPDIRDFVRRCLAESPLTDEGNREVGETVFRALLDAAGPTGSIHVAFRIFPEHVEVDVLHSDNQTPADRFAPTSGVSAANDGGPITPTVRSRPASSLGQAVSGAGGAGSGDGQGTATGAARGADSDAAGAGGSGAADPNRGPVPAGGVPLGQPGQPATFAEWMSTALRREGLTQEQAARQLGVSVKTISRWVGGATEPRMRDLRRIQEVFGQVPLP
jgi:DNA-binding XRE family transcriptional regulator